MSERPFCYRCGHMVYPDDLIRCYDEDWHEACLEAAETEMREEVER